MGKKVIYLTECHSTNEELLKLTRKEKIPEGTVIYAGFQLSGKGQRGNSWESNPNENALFSFLLKPSFLDVGLQFLLTFSAAMSICEVANQYAEQDGFKVKWPNDVYYKEKKVAGILTECTLRNRILENAVVGIGININQEKFTNPNAVSLSTVLNSRLSVENFIEEVISKYEKYYLMLKSNRHSDILESYKCKMLAFNEVRNYKKGDTFFTGKIVDVEKDGRLKMEIDENVQVFNFKEIEFVIS